LNDNKIKHISRTKTDIKLYISSFSVVNIPVIFLLGLGHLGGCMWNQLSSVSFCFSWRDVFCETESGLHSVAGRTEILYPCSMQMYLNQTTNSQNC